MRNFLPSEAKLVFDTFPYLDYVQNVNNLKITQFLVKPKAAKKFAEKKTHKKTVVIFSRPKFLLFLKVLIFSSLRNSAEYLCRRLDHLNMDIHLSSYITSLTALPIYCFAYQTHVTNQFGYSFRIATVIYPQKTDTHCILNQIQVITKNISNHMPSNTAL